jgi:Uma2 family endonuclease
MSATIKAMTAEDLLRMPDDGFRYELVRGELRKITPAGQRHGKIAATITASLVQHVIANKLGAVYAAETGFQLRPDHVRAPDVAFVRRDRVERVGDVEGFWPGAPDLAVEVISPGDTYGEVEEKVMDWLEAGTPMVIIVNPRKRAVTIYRSLTAIVILTENEIVEGQDIVPGWSLKVSALFA